MILVPDTNLIISAWIFDRRPFAFFEAALDAGFKFALCQAIIDEFYDILSRPKSCALKARATSRRRR